MLRKAKEFGYQSVIILDHKDCYPNFRFKPASLWSILLPFGVPDEVFMALGLTKDSVEKRWRSGHCSRLWAGLLYSPVCLEPRDSYDTVP